MGFARRAGRIYTIAMGALLLVAALVSPSRVLPLLSLFIAAALIHIVIHELGHAVAAWAVRYRVVRIVSGTGPRLASVQVLGTLLELRLIPAGGHMLAASRHPNDQGGARWREFLTVAGGPLATVLVIVMARTVVPDSFATVGADATQGLSGVSLAELLQRLGWWMLITNLVPWSPQLDGSRMVALLRADKDSVAEAADLRGIAESMHHFERGDLDRAIDATADYGDNTAAAAMHAAALSRAGRFVEARAVLVPLMAQDLPEARQLVVANNLAWVDVNLGTPHLVAEADHWSQLAETMAGELPVESQAPIASTRARVLSALGRHDEAAERFDTALSANLDDFTRAEVLAGRARNRLAAGDALGGRQDADRAVALAPESPVVLQAVHLVDNVSLTVVAEQAGATPDGWVLPPALLSPAGRPTVSGARRALAKLDSPEPLLSAIAAEHGLTPTVLGQHLAVLLGLQSDDENRSSIQAVS